MQKEVDIGMLVLAHVIMVVGPAVVYVLFSNSEKIRNSKYWFFACMGYLFTLVQTFGAASVLMNHYNVSAPPEEIGIPVIIGTLAVVVALTFYVKVYRPSRRYISEQKK